MTAALGSKVDRQQASGWAQPVPPCTGSGRSPTAADLQPAHLLPTSIPHLQRAGGILLRRAAALGVASLLDAPVLLCGPLPPDARGLLKQLIILSGMGAGRCATASSVSRQWSNWHMLGPPRTIHNTMVAPPTSSSSTSSRRRFFLRRFLASAAPCDVQWRQQQAKPR